MAKRCKRNGDISDRIILTRPLKDKNGYYFPVCMLPRHIGIIKNQEYHLKRCTKDGRNPCVHYRRFIDESSLALYTSRESISIEVRTN